MVILYYAALIHEAYCPGGTNEKEVRVPAGYYPVPSVDDPKMLIKCRNSTVTSNPCNPNNEPVFTCEAGTLLRILITKLPRIHRQALLSVSRWILSLGRRMCEMWRLHRVDYVHLYDLCGCFLRRLHDDLTNKPGSILRSLVTDFVQWRRATFTVLVFYLQTSAYLLSSGTLPVLKTVRFLNVAYGTAFFRLVGAECFDST